MAKIKLILCSLTLIVIFGSCKNDTQYLYEVNDVNIQSSDNKQNVKTNTEFVSIAYSDLFNTTIPNDTLVALIVAYTSFGDKKLIEDRIVRHFLNSPSVALPTNTQMRNDVDGFVKATYNKLFNREPNAFEKYYIKNLIETDNTITPELVYYSFMTGNEYRYY